VSHPERTVHALVRAGVTHVVGIPDNTSGPLFDALEVHPTLRLITVTREGEAFALASGLWLGGASPLVVIQNTGLLESGDALRGTAVRMGAAVPMVVTGRGYARMLAAGIGPDDERTPQLLQRVDIDSTALLTEPTLRAWGIPFRTCSGEDDPGQAIADTVAAARDSGHPSALILLRSVN
jgi:sulfopyruvate decarboxylase subunit alpha